MSEWYDDGVKTQHGVNGKKKNEVYIEGLRFFFAVITEFVVGTLYVSISHEIKYFIKLMTYKIVCNLF